MGCTDAQELTAKEKKEQSAVERFQYFREAHTYPWYEQRHEMAQTFLDRFVRQNIAEIDEIPWREQAVRIQLVRHRPPSSPNAPAVLHSPVEPTDSSRMTPRAHAPT